MFISCASVWRWMLSFCLHTSLLPSPPCAGHYITSTADCFRILFFFDASIRFLGLRVSVVNKPNLGCYDIYLVSAPCTYVCIEVHTVNVWTELWLFGGQGGWENGESVAAERGISLLYWHVNDFILVGVLFKKAIVDHWDELGLTHFPHLTGVIGCAAHISIDFTHISSVHLQTSLATATLVMSYKIDSQGTGLEL